MKIINIDIETHNVEDYYYTHYYNNLFVTHERSDREIRYILNSIIPKEYIDKSNSCCGYNEIDFEDLKKQLLEHGIVMISSDINYMFDLKEED